MEGFSHSLELLLLLSCMHVIHKSSWFFDLQFLYDFYGRCFSCFVDNETVAQELTGLSTSQTDELLLERT